jgi:hypothetical protein
VTKKVSWAKGPTEAEYRAALNYLSLVFPEGTAAKLVSALRQSALIQRAAKDLLRASNLPLLDATEPKVKSDLKRLRKGKALSPVLLIRGNTRRVAPLVVADGYHRICAVCYFDEDAPIACRVAS